MPSDGLTRITCVLFDMDGVLVDVSGSYRAAIARTAEAFTGKPVTPGAIQTLKNRGGFNDDWELTHAIIGQAGIVVSFDDVVREFQNLYRGSNWNGLIRQETPLLERSLLEDLVRAGADLGVVTGRPKDEARWTLEHFQWSDLFAVLVAREQQHDRPKPDGYPLTRALGLLPRTHSASRTVYLGDTVDDMRAAKNAGVIPIGFVPPYLDPDTHGPLLQRHGARMVISSYGVLPQALGMDQRRPAP